MLISNIINQYSFIIPIVITKIITFYTFVLTLGLSFYNFIRNAHSFMFSLSIVTFLTVYTVNKVNEFTVKILYYSDRFSKLIEKNKLFQQLITHPNTQKTIFLHNCIKNYISTKINHYKMNRKCGVQQLNDRLVFTFVHKDTITRIPIVFNSFNIQTITKIEYVLFGKSVYDSQKEHIEYIKSFISNKYRNIRITPGCIGYEKIRITSLDEDFNIIQTEYLTTEYIN